MSETNFQALSGSRRKPAEPVDLETLQRLHEDFLAQWLQALRVLLPASVGVEIEQTAQKTYAEFLRDCSPNIDIEVFEVEAWQALCAWCLDSRWTAAAVDCLFGGGARLPIRADTGRRPNAIELGVRRRLLDSLASAYEAAWASTHPIRLQSLRSEDNLINLRVAAAADPVLHLQLQFRINSLHLPVHACLPVRCLQGLRKPASELAPAMAAAGLSATAEPAAVAGTGVMSAPVPLQAVLAHADLTVAQLMALSVGQVIPLNMREPVTLRVRGVPVGTAQHGVRNGRYAVRIEQMDNRVSAGSTGLPALDLTVHADTRPGTEPDGSADTDPAQQASRLLSSINLDLGPDSSPPKVETGSTDPQALSSAPKA